MSSFGTFPVQRLEARNEARNANIQENAVDGFNSQSEIELPLSAVSDSVVKLNYCYK